MMKITLKDGSVKEYENQMAVIDIAKDISEAWPGWPARERLTGRRWICAR